MNEKCGVAKCHDENGNVIPCTNTSIEYSSINTLEDSLTDFKVTVVQSKNRFALFIIGIMFLMFSLIFTRFFEDDLKHGTFAAKFLLIGLIIIFVVLSAVKIVKEDDDLSKYF